MEEDKQTIYPTPTEGMGMTGAMQPQQPVLNAPAEVAPRGFSKMTAALIILLILTFFTPLGSALFLPLVVVGFFAAYNSAHNKGKNTYVRTATGEFVPVKPSVIGSIIKGLMIFCGVIGVIVLALIGFFFIAIATGGADFRMGS